MYWLRHRHRSDAATRQASSHRGECSFAPRLCCCCCSAFDLAFDLRRPVKPRWPQAGIAQWAPRHGCRGSRDTAMDGRSRRAHGAMPDCGHAEPRRGTEWWGKSPFGYFWGSFPKVTRCKSGTNSRRNRSNGYVHNPRKELCRSLYLRPSRASPLPHKPHNGVMSCPKIIARRTPAH